MLKLGNGKLKCREDEHVKYSIEIPHCGVVTDDIVDSVFDETFSVTLTILNHACLESIATTTQMDSLAVNEYIA